jgi:hypothetical protein
MEIMHGLVLFVCYKCGHLRFSNIICLTENKGNVVGRSISSGNRFECGFGIDYFIRDENDIKLSEIKSQAHNGEINFLAGNCNLAFVTKFLPKRSGQSPALLSNQNQNKYCCKNFVFQQEPN